MKKLMLWMMMAGYLFLAMSFINAYQLTINYCPNLQFTDNSTNITTSFSCTPLNVTVPDTNVTYITNITNQNITNLNFTFYNGAMNGTAVSLLISGDGTLYAVPLVFYNKTESDALYLTKTDFTNFKTFTLSNYIQFSNNFSNVSYSIPDMVNNITQLRSDVNETKNYVDGQTFTSFWKVLVVISLLFGLVGIGFGVKTMMS